MGRPRKIVPEGVDSSIITTPLGEDDDTLSLPLQDETIEESVEVAVISEIKGRYATEYFKKNGIPYCEVCGAQYQTDSKNNPVCPEKLTSCPRTVNNV